LYAQPSHTPANVVVYDVPALGVAIIGGGPLTERILHTLTRSPRTVAVASGSAPAVPSGWHTVTFQGLVFDAPRSWTVTRTQGTDLLLGAICRQSGVALGGIGVILDTDQQILPVPFCPNMRSNPPQPPTDGVQVDTGRYEDFVGLLHLSFSTQCLELHGLTACPATTPDYSILVLRVTAPGRTTSVLVSVGLAGSGTVARTILYSLRAA
jgi:hypothetical protein